MPQGERWHQALLSQMATEIPDIRPALIPAACEHELMRLLAFRHFFRHAYAIPLDPEHLHKELIRVQTLTPIVDTCLTDFTHFLDSAISTLTESS